MESQGRVKESQSAGIAARFILRRISCDDKDLQRAECGVALPRAVRPLELEAGSLRRPLRGGGVRQLKRRKHRLIEPAVA